MDKYGIQVNKTSRNSVLFMTNIGTTRSSVAYLIEVLVKIAEDLDEELAQLGPLGQAARNRRVAALTSNPPPLPNFSHFADRFRHDANSPDGDLRAAYFLAYVAGAVSTFPPRSWPLGSQRAGRWCRRCSSRRTHRASRSSSPGRS